MTNIPKQFKTPTTKDAYLHGFERGFNCASWQDLPEIGEKTWTVANGHVIADESNMWDIVQDRAFEAEAGDREYSPFEFTASEFNKARNSEARWEAFDAGISDGISANIQQRMAKYNEA